MSERCSVCSVKATRDLVDRALLAGETPSDVLRSYPDLGISRSALFRHARSHQRRNIITAKFLDGETTTGEVLADLAGLRRSLLEQYSVQRAEGNDAASTRTAREAHAISNSLLKAGATDDDAAESFRYFERLAKAVQLAARRDPSHARALAVAAREGGDLELSEDLESVANSFNITN